MSFLDRLRRPPGHGPATADQPADGPPAEPYPGDVTARGRVPRAVAAWTATGLAALLVLAALVAPSRFGDLSPAAFAQIPLEGLLAVALVLAVPARTRRAVVTLLGLTLGLLTVLKILDVGFSAVLDRPFDPVLDWVLFDDAVGYLTDSAGRPGAIGAVAAAVLLVVAVVALTTLSAVRLTGLVVRHHRAAVRGVAVLTVAWLACAAFGVRVEPGVPVAGRGVSALVHAHAVQVRAGLRDREAFAAEVAVDPFRDTPGERLLTGLRGKDVIVAFVESYGRDAVEDPEFAPRVGAMLTDADRRLRAAGYASRSGFLTSPTAGGGSWLAHATLLSGLWIDDGQRHSALLASDRLTLGGAFKRAGWETVGVMPAATQPWPEGRFYGYDRFHDADALGYRGPKFGYAPMPDQYTLATFERLEHGRTDRGPIMAEIPLVSSHSPWTPVPRLLDWADVGDGSVYRDAGAGTPGDADRRDVARMRADYRRSIEYSLSTLVSYVERHGNDDLVLVFLGDHQPAPVITGEDASRDVPVTIVARDRAVLDRMTGWGWEDGLRPGPRAPVWRMDAFRDRFLTAFGP